MKPQPARQDDEVDLAPYQTAIIDSLADIHAELQDALAAGDLGWICNGVGRLGQFRKALEARVEKSRRWD